RQQIAFIHTIGIQTAMQHHIHQGSRNRIKEQKKQGTQQVSSTPEIPFQQIIDAVKNESKVRDCEQDEPETHRYVLPPIDYDIIYRVKKPIQAVPFPLFIHHVIYN